MNPKPIFHLLPPAALMSTWACLIALPVRGVEVFTDQALTIPGLTGSYVNRSLETVRSVEDWRGSQTISGTRIDTAPNFTTESWGARSAVGVTGGSDADWENFSVQWDGWLKVTAAGQRYATVSDDGSRMWIDVNQNGSFDEDELLDNGWGRDQAVIIRDRSVALPAGSYRIRIQYYEIGGGNEFHLVSPGWVPRQFTPSSGNPRQVVRAMVLNFEPRVPSHGNKRLWEVFNWQDPRKMARQFEADLEYATGGAIDIQIVEERHLDEMPLFEDGFRYSPDQYVQNWQTNSGWRMVSDAPDFYHLARKQGLEAMVNSVQIDEVWIFTGPYMANFGESWMAGTNSFFINGPSFTDVGFDRAIAGYGFSYERDIAEMLHNLGHRTENHGQRAFGSWNLTNPQTAFDHFSANDLESPGKTAGVGTCHVPLNATAHYEYGNPRMIASTAFDWANYPAITGATTLVGFDTWKVGSAPIDHRDYLNFYFGMMPRNAGAAADGRQANWFKYIWDFNSYEAGTGRPRNEDAFGAGSTIVKAGATTHDFTVRYYDAAGIDPGTLGDGNVRVTGPGGFSQTATLINTGTEVATTAGTARTVTYRIAAPGGVWDQGDNGLYRLNMLANQVRDTLGNVVPSGQVGHFRAEIGLSSTSDTAPPQATATSADVSTAGATSHFIEVVITDASPVDAKSLETGNLTVSGPGGFSVATIFYSIDNHLNGTPRRATYWFIPPGGTWESTDNGIYTLTLEAGSVRDVFGNTPQEARTLGAFMVNIAAPVRRPADDLAEKNSENWLVTVENGTGSTAHDATRTLSGTGSIRFTTDGGFDNRILYRDASGSDWDLSGAENLNFSIYAENSNDGGFQENSPWIRLTDLNGGYFEYRYYQSGFPFDLLNQSIGRWREFSVPLSAADDMTNGWRRLVVGSPRLDHIASLEFHADTWGGGFHLWFDAVGFDLPPAPPATSWWFEPASGIPNRLFWQTEPGLTYDLWESVNLVDWARVEGYPKVAVEAIMSQAITPAPGGRKFFRLGPPENRPASSTKKVLVLNIDPILEAHGGQRLHQYLGWNDPRVLNAAYLQDLTTASGGYVQWEVAAWVDLDLWPRKSDGFQYTDTTYLQSWFNSAQHPWHSPDGSDYEPILDLPLEPLGNKTAHQMASTGEVDEVIWWAGPYLGFFESRMVGKTAYWCNSPPLRRDSPLYVVMALNPERGVAEALHSFGHRCESILSHVYGSWSGNSAVNHLWDRFTRVGPKHGGALAGCGNVHFPPNASNDYEYGVFTPVDSEADRWLNYPDLTGSLINVNASTWGGLDHHRNFLRWWMARFPKVPGRYVDPANSINHGKLNNWWGYLVDMNEYAESR